MNIGNIDCSVAEHYYSSYSSIVADMLPDLAEIRKRRRSLGLTQQELAVRVVASRSAIAKVETGRLIPRYDVAKRVLDELEILEMQRRAGKTLVNVKIGDVACGNVEYVEADETVYEVWRKMNETSFSQFPVRKAGQILGSVTERGINRALMAGGSEVRNKPVETILDEPFPLFSSATTLVDVIPLLQRFQAILVLEKGNIVGIVTNTDVGRVFSGRGD